MSDTLQDKESSGTAPENRKMEKTATTPENEDEYNEFAADDDNDVDDNGHFIDAANAEDAQSGSIDEDASNFEPGTNEYYAHLNRTISSSISRSLTNNDPNLNVMERLSQLSTRMAEMTANEMETFQLDPRDFD